MKKRPAGHDKPDSWGVNISFNLMVNAKVKGLDMTLNKLASYADGFWLMVQYEYIILDEELHLGLLVIWS